jgi:hypothetical protein
VGELFRRTIIVPFFDYLKGRLQTRFDWVCTWWIMKKCNIPFVP